MAIQALQNCRAFLLQFCGQTALKRAVCLQAKPKVGTRCCKGSQRRNLPPRGCVFCVKCAKIAFVPLVEQKTCKSLQFATPWWGILRVSGQRVVAFCCGVPSACKWAVVWCNGVQLLAKCATWCKTVVKTSRSCYNVCSKISCKAMCNECCSHPCGGMVCKSSAVPLR